MTILTNPADHNALAALTRNAPGHVVSAVRQASSKTGVDFAYLLQQAKAESSFKTDIKAKTSSASGLYQFIESTWLQMVKTHGHKYGLEDEAAKIDAKGRVADPADRQKILSLRNDAEISSLLAAELAADNKKFLERNWSGKAGATELYLAHFMGAGGAASFLQAKDKNPLQFGADLFPKEAAANRNVFYNPETGKPRTLSEIHDFFSKKFTGGPQVTANKTAPDPAPSVKPAARSWSPSMKTAFISPVGQAKPASSGFMPIFSHDLLLAPQDILLLGVLRDLNS